MLAKVARLLLELHRDCRRPAVDEFPGWAMNLVQMAIRHDDSFWGMGNLVEREIVAHSFWVSSDSMTPSMHAWESNKHLDTVGPLQYGQPGRAINVTHAQLRTEHKAVYESVYRLSGIEQHLGVYAQNAATGIWDGLSVYRFDPAAPFSEEERYAVECLVPHLIEARRANFLSHMGAAECQIAASAHQLAAADAKGVLHAAQEGFAALMRLEWPDWHGPRLPAAVVAQLAAGRRYVGAALAVDFEPVLDMTLLHARRRSAIDELSPRQLDIACGFSAGRSHKEIARDFNLSPATVRNHLAMIYDTLAIGSKAELATLLARQGRGSN